MDKQTFESHKPYAGEAKPSMHRRRVGHDYSSRCIYLVTMTTEGRRPLLGTLTGSADAPDGSPDAPHIVLTPLGERVRRAWEASALHYEGVQVLATMVMPDHLHGILFFKEQSKATLGTVIKGFKAGCNKAYRQLLEEGKAPQPQASLYAGTACQPQPKGQQPPQGQPLPRPARRDREHGLLWSPNYNDHILEGEGALQRWFTYLRENPWRLAMRRANREYFRVRFDVVVAGRTYAAIGNRFLLDRPQKEQVQCSRSLTPAQVEAEVATRLERARQGVVLVSPSFSEGEKAVMEAVLAARLPLIFLTPNGFNEYSRPGHRYYEACAEGRFLILAPWPHQNREVPLTRSMCLELNTMAAEVAEGR